jgi:hypothetical protein
VTGMVGCDKTNGRSILHQNGGMGTAARQPAAARPS